MLGLVVACDVVASAVISTCRRRRDEAVYLLPDPVRVIASVTEGRTPGEGVPEVVRAVIGEVLGAPPGPVAMATLDEALGDVGRGLSSALSGTRGWVRVCLAGGTFGGVIEALAALRGSAARGTGVTVALAAFATGVVGAGVVGAVSRSLSRDVEASRGAWDRLAAVLSRRAAAGPAQGQMALPGPTAATDS